MNLAVGGKIEMKKNHPCSSGKSREKAVIFTVLRTGADIKIKCDNCGRELMLPRFKVEKMIKKLID